MNETTKIMPGAITHTLLIWEMEDNRAMFVLIPNSVLTECDFEMFRSVHGKCLNADDCSKQEYTFIANISEMLSGQLDGEGKPLRFHRYIVDNGRGETNVPIEETIITRVYRTGWF